MQQHRPKPKPGLAGAILKLYGFSISGTQRRAWPDSALAAMAAMSAKQPESSTIALEKLREEFDQLGRQVGRTTAPVKRQNRQVRGAGGPLEARRYTPKPPIRARLVFYHGGGWIIGSLNSHDDFCAFIAQACGAEVLSVSYRLAPLHPFPAAAEDAIATASLLADTALWTDASTPGLLGGDSAGGNLALLGALESATADPEGVWLIYTSADIDDDRSLPKCDDPGGLGITEATAKWFADTYVPDPLLWSHKWLRPGRSSNLARLPPTYIGYGTRDPLRFQNEALIERLERLGVDVSSNRFEGLPHAFIHMIGVSPTAYTAACNLADGLARLIDKAEAQT